MIHWETTWGRREVTREETVVMVAVRPQKMVAWQTEKQPAEGREREMKKKGEDDFNVSFILILLSLVNRDKLMLGPISITYNNFRDFLYFKFYKIKRLNSGTIWSFTFELT